MIEVRYAGVVVGRSSVIRELDTRGLFLGISEPLPVGTAVELRIGDHPAAPLVPGKVETVSESQDSVRAGMRIRFADPAAAQLFGSPSEAPPEPELVLDAAPIPSATETAGAAPPVPSSESEAPTSPPDASVSGQHRRIVVDASTEPRQPVAVETEGESSAVDPPGDPEADASGAVAVDAARIPAPDPSAFGGGGKKGRRQRRR